MSVLKHKKSDIRGNKVKEKKSQKQRDKTKYTIVIMTILSFVILYTYYYISTNTSSILTIRNTGKSEYDILLEKDMNKAYPATPKEVLKLYSRILKCLYNDNLSEEQIEKLVEKIRLLYDKELLSENSEQSQLISLKEEIDKFKESKGQLTKLLFENSEPVMYWTQDEVEYASIIASYTINESGSVTKVLQEFIMRKNDEGIWKILGWKND